MRRFSNTFYLTSLVLTLALGLAAGQARGDGPCMDVDELNRAIEEAGADWKAGPTSMSCLSEEEKARFFTPLPTMPHAPSPPAVDLQPLLPDVSPDLPRHSWHDYEGEDWMTPVKNQGLCGGCWAFAAVAAVEGAFNVELGDPDIDIDLSEQYIIACADGSCEGGGVPQTVFEYIYNNGIPDEACYPYIEVDGRCSDRCSDWESRVFNIQSYGWLGFINRERTMKERIAIAPIVGSMTVYTDFLSYTEGVYRHVSGGSEGGHSISIVGWDDAHNSWICKNSWGGDWGMDGYFEISRSETFFAFDAAWVDVDSATFPGFPCLTPESIDVEVVSRGDSLTLDLELRNCGGLVLDWTSMPDPETGWLAVAPPSGTLNVGETQAMTVTIDPTTMSRLGEWHGSARAIGPMGEDRTYLNINVIAQPPAADFSADPVEGPAPLDVQFTELATGTIETYAWDFGDGTSDGARNPLHTYAEPGTYTVSLAVSGSEGESTETKTDYIHVLPAEQDASEDVADVADDAVADGDEEGGSEAGGGGCGCAVAR